MTVDELLYQGNAGNSAILTGTVDMTVSGNTLTIVLTNTSASQAIDGSGAWNLMTGVGFTMPTGYSIASGIATVTAGSMPAFPAITNISSEWGFSNTPTSGHFDGSPSVYGYDSVVGTVTSDVQTVFAAGSVGGPPGLGGPDFGLLSSLVAGSAAGGQIYAHSPLTVVLTLNQSVAAGTESSFLNVIESNPVGIAFASPSTSFVAATVPEPNSLLMWTLGLGLLGCASQWHRGAPR